jgi:hypothetical protein
MTPAGDASAAGSQIDLTADYRAARADAARRGVRQWYLIGIRKYCNMYPDGIRIAE